ncbi:hypothetical protein llap_19945 [Limosa lapponica baueri]|uniref:Uncharacterized protein n=1 Tax=Limosa lapponica baueri TaxID=1758121 RepID=A0A2I0T7H1_LIMLA|nr:hypothetical protein llap_19945 [Limosa lapponica baueri]
MGGETCFNLNYKASVFENPDSVDFGKLWAYWKQAKGERKKGERKKGERKKGERKKGEREKSHSIQVGAATKQGDLFFLPLRTVHSCSLPVLDLVIMQLWDEFISLSM